MRLYVRFNAFVIVCLGVALFAGRRLVFEALMRQSSVMIGVFVMSLYLVTTGIGLALFRQWGRRMTICLLVPYVALSLWAVIRLWGEWKSYPIPQFCRRYGARRARSPSTVASEKYGGTFCVTKIRSIFHPFRALVICLLMVLSTALTVHAKAIQDACSIGDFEAVKLLLAANPESDYSKFMSKLH